jgi:Ca2+-binding RTX toxin-like protein
MYFVLSLLIVFGSLLTSLLVENVTREDDHGASDQNFSTETQDDWVESLDDGVGSEGSLLDWAGDPLLSQDDDIFADEGQSSSPNESAPDSAEVKVIDSDEETTSVIVLEGGYGDFAGEKAAETLHVESGYFGTIDAAAGDDTITAVGPDAGVAMVYIDRSGMRDFVWIDDNFESLDQAPLSIRVGEGNDRINISGTRIEVSTGGGQDHVDMSAASQAVVWANSGDQVYGSDLIGPTDLHVLIDGAGHFFGGMADEHAIALNDGASLEGGAGNDTLESDDGSAELYGGSGDDILAGNVQSAIFQRGSTDRIVNHTDASSDSLFGGDGDDQLLLSRTDVATGGLGADLYTIFDNYDNGDAAVIRDFDPNEDRLVIYSGETGGYPADGGMALIDRISVVEQNGTTIVMNGNDVLARLEGVTNLSFGLATQSAGGLTSCASLDGMISDFSSFDVIIAALPATSS